MVVNANRGPAVLADQGRTLRAVVVIHGSKLEGLDALALEVVASGILRPAPDAILARPEFQEFRQELIRRAFQAAESGEDPLEFHVAAFYSCRNKMRGKGKETRARRIAVRAEAMLRLVRMIGPERVQEMIVTP